MKIRPRVPGVSPTEGAGGAEGPESASRAKGFAAALRAGATPDVGAPAGIPPAALERIVERLAAGEITRSDAAAQVAAEIVRSWPADAFDEAERARAAEELADVLSEDPTFAALLDAAAGGSR